MHIQIWIIVHMDVHRYVTSHIFYPHIFYPLQQEGEIEKKKPFILESSAIVKELQEPLVFLMWTDLFAFVFSSELLSCVDTGLTILWKQLLLASLRRHFASQKFSCDLYFRKTLQVRIIHECFYAFRVNPVNIL